jgi:DNA replication protein DnaC
MRAPQIGFGQLVQDFFLRRLVTQRGASARTVESYRDAFELLFGFVEQRMRLETWDTTAAVRYDQQLWTELTSLRFLDGPHGALLLGPVGVGKTHLATALGHIAIRRRHSVHMARADKLFKRLKAARLDNTVEAEMRRLTHVQLLILDDFALQPLDATETTDFYEPMPLSLGADLGKHA